MSILPRLTTIAVLSLSTTATMWGECSDAGGCAVLRAPAVDSWSGFDARLGVTPSWAKGGSDGDNITYLGVSLDAAVSFPTRTSIGLRVPVLSIDGDLGDATSLGDTQVFVCQAIPTLGLGTWSVMAGARLPTGDDQANPNLGQAYQTGLGGVDMTVGAGWTFANLELAAAYTIAAGANDLPSTQLERGDDLMGLVGYSFSLASVRPSAQLIVIKRLDEATVSDGLGGRVTVKNSDSLQVNLRLGLRIPFDDHLVLDGAFIAALRDRDHNEDGLIRSSSAQLGLTYQW